MATVAVNAHRLRTLTSRVQLPGETLCVTPTESLVVREMTLFVGPVIQHWMIELDGQHLAVM